MPATRSLPGLVAAVAVLVSCGSSATSPGTNTSTPAAATTTTTLATTTTSVAVTTTAVAVTTTTVEATTTTGVVVEPQQPAIWPAAGVVIDSPEQVAAEFVTEVLGVEPVLGDFKQGDSRSGEIEVFSPGEGAAAIAVSRGVLLLRQLGAGNGWFIIGVANEHATITSPGSMAVVAAGPLTVEGVARGQEANVVVTAFEAGNAKAVLDSKFTMAGALETSLPYTVTLDLSRATPGEVVALLVRGGAGLETDPGEFGAIPIVIAG